MRIYESKTGHRLFVAEIPELGIASVECVACGWTELVCRDELEQAITQLLSTGQIEPVQLSSLFKVHADGC